MSTGALKLNSDGSVGQQDDGSVVQYASDEDAACCCGFTCVPDSEGAISDATLQAMAPDVVVVPAFVTTCNGCFTYGADGYDAVVNALNGHEYLMVPDALERIPLTGFRILYTYSSLNRPYTGPTSAGDTEVLVTKHPGDDDCSETPEEHDPNDELYQVDIVFRLSCTGDGWSYESGTAVPPSSGNGIFASVFTVFQNTTGTSGAWDGTTPTIASEPNEIVWGSCADPGPPFGDGQLDFVAVEPGIP